MKKFTTIKTGVLLSSALLLGTMAVSAQMMDRGTEAHTNGEKGYRGTMKGNHGTERSERSERGDGDREGDFAGDMGQGMMLGMNMNMGGIVGQVSSVSGSLFTVMARAMGNASTGAVPYTVDASQAVFMKNRATTTASALLVGDRVFVSGNATGTAIAAKYVTIMGTSTPMTNGGERGRGMMGNNGGGVMHEGARPFSGRNEDTGFLEE